MDNMEEVNLAMGVWLEDDKVLMLRRRSPEEWQLPGAKTVDNEQPLAALVRGVHQKTGAVIRHARQLHEQPEILMLGERALSVVYFQIHEAAGNPMNLSLHTYSEVGFQPAFSREVDQAGVSPALAHLDNLLTNRTVQLAVQLELPGHD